MALASGQMGIHSGEKHLVLGLDPGRDKTGFAFTDIDGSLQVSGIFPSSERAAFFEDFTPYIIERNTVSFPRNAVSCLAFIAIGDGTTSREFSEYVRGKAKCQVISVDERNTTLEARGLYWKLHKPGFLLRLLPEGLRVPSRVLDDLAAWAVALRALKKYRDISRNKL